MDLEQINASIRELEAQILASEIEQSPLHSSRQSTPKSEGPRQSTRDSGFSTMHIDDYLDGAQMSPNTSIAQSLQSRDKKRKSVRFSNMSQNEQHNVRDPNDDKYDLSRYLTKNNDSSHQPTNMSHVTTRHKRSMSPNELSKQRQKIKPAIYDGTTPWLDYKSHFEACAQLCEWSEVEKGLFLSVSLRGLAQGILGNLSPDKQLDYNELTSALSDRFSPPDQMELYRIQLKERRQKATESLPELGQHIRRLTNLAYPTVPQDVREALAKDQFIDALCNSDMRIRIKQARPRNLNDAVRHAVELEAYFKAEGKLLESKSHVLDLHCAEDNQSQASAISESSKDNTQIQSALADISKSLEQMSVKITVLIGAVSFTFLIDTGASLSILSKQVYDRIKNDQPLELIKKHVVAANADPLKVYGRTKIRMKIGRNTYETTVVVADLTSDGVLGLDFMLNNAYIVNVNEQTLTMRDESIPLIKSGHFGCFRVALAENINIPPKSELITTGNVCLPD
ncbi:hypothetical protein FSP39_018923 [Pinctada imbricata]|uniref:Peptidase A2 domain-containing protein n=1 Tax=Pinctada imbricata TaxID=66713 RepID=A0AA88YK16_PINIB|nr:hypothetical protein FSP39_018923 [Pinctada imbricata]